MPETKYHVPSLCDEQIYDSFLTVFKKLCDTKKVTDVRIGFSTPLSHSAYSIGYNEQFDQKTEKILKCTSNKIIYSSTITFLHFNLTYNRVPSVPNGSYGEIKINVNSKLTIGDEDLFPIISGLVKEMYVGKIDRAIETDKGLIASHSEVLSKLQSLGLDIQKDTKVFRDSLEKEYVEKRNRLEQEFNQKNEELDRKYKEKNDELERIRKEVDDKSNTHARRENQKKIIQTIKDRIENFKLSNDTSKLRGPIHVAFIALILLSATGTLIYSLEYLNLLQNSKFLESNAAVLIALLKPLTLTLLFSSTFIFYIKWLNAWFDRIAEEEITLRKFQLDIERSSWIVETVLESVSQHEHQLPSELILSFSKNLFSKDVGNTKKISHPIDDLASALIGSASRVQLDVNGNKIDFEHKGIKDLKNKI